MHSIKSISMLTTLVMTSLLAQSAIGARNEALIGEFSPNPTAQVINQIQTVNVQIGLIDSSFTTPSLHSAVGPNLVQDIDETMAPIVASLSIEQIGVNDKLNLSLAKLKETGSEIDLGGEIKLSALPTASGDKNFQCLATALYFEARGESLNGQRAVAEVIINRSKSGLFPSTICGVVNQGTGKRNQCQFSFACDAASDEIRDQKAYAAVAKVARLMLDGLYKKEQLTKGALFYHTTAVRPSWSRKKTQTAKLGTHLFFR